MYTCMYTCKTNYTLFKSHRKPALKDNPGIKIQDLLLNQVESTRFLGIHVDQHLTWKTHISEISLKIAKNIGVIGLHHHIITSSFIQKKRDDRPHRRKRQLYIV